MTEPNTRPARRQQPEQARTDVATAPGDTEKQLSAREQRKQEMKERASFVAGVVRAQEATLAKLLPSHLTPPTFMASAGAALYRNEALLIGASESPEAFLIALREAAALGHVPGTEHYWLTPRRDDGRPSVLGIEGYEGIIERMYRSGGVLSVHASIVRANDTFVEFAGPGGRPLHTKAGKWGVFSPESERGEIVGTYAYAMLPGGVSSEVITIGIEELLAHRAKHAARNPIWDKDPVPMYKKTGLRRLEKYVPVSSGYRSTAVQATAFVAAAAPAQLTGRMEDNAVDGDDTPPVEATAGQPQGGPAAGTAVPVDGKFNAADWTDDKAWADLPVTRPGTGVPDAVKRDAAP